MIRKGKTKIVATIGPSSMDYAIMKKMVQEGMDVVRINLSHATEESCNTTLKIVKKLRKELHVPLPIMLDTRGPELRILKFKNNKVNIQKGQAFSFVDTKCLGDENKVGLNVPQVISKLKVKDKILANDGLIELRVEEVRSNEVVTRAVNSGMLSNNKSLFIPNVDLKLPYLNKLDKQNLLWGIKNNVDLVAISFVNTKQDVLEVKKFIKSHGGNMRVISKIESACGVKNLEEIMAVSDGVMVARGDLGVEVAVEKLPAIQKAMICKANTVGLPIITATEMLESMNTSPRPTRAEVSDVANAVYDGTSAVMLSGETASGSYPVESVRAMAKIVLETEKDIKFEEVFNKLKTPNTQINTIAHSAVAASFGERAKTILSFTTTGETAQMISRFKPTAQILAATPNEQVYRQMEILWGVTPVLTSVFENVESVEKMANNLIKKNGAKLKEKAIVVYGTPKHAGQTNLIKIHQVK